MLLRRGILPRRALGGVQVVRCCVSVCARVRARGTVVRVCHESEEGRGKQALQYFTEVNLSAAGTRARLL